MRSTEPAIISSYPASVSGIIVLLNTKHWLKISQSLFSTKTSFRPFWGNIFRDKIVSFRIRTNYIKIISYQPSCSHLSQWFWNFVGKVPSDQESYCFRLSRFIGFHTSQRYDCFDGGENRSVTLILWQTAVTSKLMTSQVYLCFSSKCRM